MKQFKLPKWSMFLLAGTIMTSAAFMSCKKESLNPELTSNAKPGGQVPGANCSDYVVTLDRTSDAFTTTFTWTITNPKPGNGTNGTLQNLSHWTFIPGCPGNSGLEQNWDDILSAEYNKGAGWVLITPTPELAVDPSQSCTNANVFKFNYGTSGSTPTQYRIVLAGNYARVEDNWAFFKSGANTGCCSKQIPGIGCKVEDNCSLSQGYYFAKPGPTWPTGSLEVGGQTYSEAEGRAIWDCSNQGGISDSKKAFTQVAALLLSNAYPTGDVQIDADVVTIQNYLTSLGQKLVACTYLPTGTTASAPAAAAAGRIGDWINNNHCP